MSDPQQPSFPPPSSGQQPPSGPHTPGQPSHPPQSPAAQPFGQAAPQHPGGAAGSPHGQPPYGGQQPYGQPQYGQQPALGQQPYGQPPYAQPYGQRPPTAAGGGLARIAFILALVGFGISTLYSLIYPFVFLAQPMDYEGLGVLGFVVSLLGFLAAAAALTLALLSLRRTDSRLLAGIAIGLGAAQVIGVLVSWMSGVFYTFG